MKSKNKRDLEKHWAEHTRKSATQGRIPKKGDHVGVNGRTGVFGVLEIRRIPKVVDLQSLNEQGPSARIHLKDIPWTSLIFMNHEDSSQAAAPIVREPTEDHD
jgi:hypothetical protein